jgi:osmotically inducible protein OsmC
MAVALRRVLYTAVAAADGGRPVPVGTGDWQLVQAPADPDAPSMTNPEELFAAGYASSLSAAFADVAPGFGLDVSGAEVRVETSLGKTTHGYGLGAVLTIRLPGANADTLRAAGDAAIERCPFWRATHDNIVTNLNTDT